VPEGESGGCTVGVTAALGVADGGGVALTLRLDENLN